MEELDIIELLYALKKKIIYIIITTVLFAVIGFAYSKLAIVPMYKSSTTFVLSVSSSAPTYDEEGNLIEQKITQGDISLNSSLVSTYAEILKSKSVATEVINRLNLDTSAQSVMSSIDVKSKTGTAVLVITVSNENPELAANIANTLAEIFEERINTMFNIDNLSVIDPAEPSTAPYNEATVRNTILFAAIGLILSCAVIFIIVYFDDTIKDEKDIEALLQVPVIASIPKDENRGKGE